MAFSFFLLVLALLAVNFAVNQFVHVARVTVPVTGLTEEFDGYTLLHISDLKGATFGSDQRLLSFALGSSQFDAVVLTGDMLSLHENAQPLYALIEQLRACAPDAPIYFIAGDDDPPVVSTEYFTGGSPFAPWVLGAQQRGAQLLASPQAVTRGEQTLWLMAGNHLSLDVDTMQGQFELQYLRALDSGDDNEIELATHNLRWLQETRAARQAIASEDAVITLTHTPPASSELTSGIYRDVDLVLCGHALGGLIRLPFAGPVFIPSLSLPRYGLFPGRNAHYGLTREGKTQLYVSPGLGTENDDYPFFFFRLFNPPTVTLISLTPSSI
ncbi:MAG: metallophosphoesterase [Candidatus Ventricola sp.]